MLFNQNSFRPGVGIPVGVARPVAAVAPMIGGLSQMHPASNVPTAITAPAPMFGHPEIAPGQPY